MFRPDLYKLKVTDITVDDLKELCVDTLFLERLCEQSQRRLSATNLSYIICFVAGLDTQTIANVFTVAPATVYSVRYRLRAYFPQGTILPF